MSGLLYENDDDIIIIVLCSSNDFDSAPVSRRNTAENIILFSRCILYIINVAFTYHCTYSVMMNIRDVCQMSLVIQTASWFGYTPKVKTV